MNQIMNKRIFKFRLFLEILKSISIPSTNGSKPVSQMLSQMLLELISLLSGSKNGCGSIKDHVRLLQMLAKQ